MLQAKEKEQTSHGVKEVGTIIITDRTEGVGSWPVLGEVIQRLCPELMGGVNLSPTARGRGGRLSGQREWSDHPKGPRRIRSVILRGRRDGTDIFQN